MSWYKSGKIVVVEKDLTKDIMDIGNDIVASGRFDKARSTAHHNPERSVATHSIETAEYALRMARWLNRHGFSVSEGDVVRASLLHDIGMTEDEVFLSPSRKKAFSHPREGSRIAQDEYGANDVQVDAIRRHMWPIGLTPPHSAVGWVVTAADKCCSIREAQHHAVVSAPSSSMGCAGEGSRLSLALSRTSTERDFRSVDALDTERGYPLACHEP